MKNRNNSNKIASGTDFGTSHAVQLKITNRDLLLLAGIVVAMIIAISTWIADVSARAETPKLLPQSKISIPAAINKIGKSVLRIY